MSLMREYIDKRLSIPQLEAELTKLIKAYNKLRDSYILIYASATEKTIPGNMLSQADFYMIHDLLSRVNDQKKIDVYIETRGGSAEAAEEIVRFLHKKFETVSFVVSGESKSAGTIMVLSGDEILMTDTGSLGPIDAQVRRGRSVESASDYIDWVKEKREDAEKRGKLNPFDAQMIAQITPGELGGTLHALRFAEDLVEEWLAKYKFRSWTQTETTKKPVTDKIKRKRARQIGESLTNHAIWRSHGRSIKIDDLENIGLKITRIDDDVKLAGIVYRIQAVCRLLFQSTSTFKVFITADNKIFNQAVPATNPIPAPNKLPDVVEISQKCPTCNIEHKLYAKFKAIKAIDIDAEKRGLTPIPKDGMLKCSCGFVIDMKGIVSQVEMQSGRKVITGKGGTK